MNRHWIEHIIEPKRLFLTWMPPSIEERRRCVVAELHRVDNDASLNYSVDSRDYKKAIEQKFDGYPGLPLEKIKHEKILDVFMRRLPLRERRDFARYLEAIRLPEKAAEELSDFALLGYSGAKLPDDNFDIIHPFEDVEGPCELLTKVAGFRHYDGLNEIEQIELGLEVRLEKEPNNSDDPDAVRVSLGGSHLGYINRVQAPAIGRWIQDQKNIRAWIERKNGTSDSPQIYLFISVA